jgi:hypothetical protein
MLLVMKEKKERQDAKSNVNMDGRIERMKI